MSRPSHVPIPIASSAEVSPSSIHEIPHQAASEIVASKENADSGDTSYSEMMEKSEKYQEETENMEQVVASIESNILEVRALRRQAFASKHGDMTESLNLEELCESTDDKFFEIRTRLVALGEDNLSFKENHSGHVSMLAYRAHVHRSFAHRFAGVVQEWKDTNEMLRNSAQALVDEKVEKLLSNSFEGEDGAQINRKDGDEVMLSQARAYMKDVKEFEERLDLIYQLDTDVKKIVEAHGEVDENDNNNDLGKKETTQEKMDIPHVEEDESERQRKPSRFRISWAVVPVIIITAALVLGLLTRFKPMWYKRNIREKPTMTTAVSAGKDTAILNMRPVDLTQLFEETRNLRL